MGTKFTSLYEVLLDGLKGKQVRLRSYEHNDYRQFTYNGKFEIGKITG